MSDSHSQDFDLVKEIWRVFRILSVVTVLEIVVAVTLTGHMPQMILNVFYIIMSAIKAFFIVGTFMHLKFERKYLIMTILIPMILLLFALGVFLAEGASWHQMKNY